MKKNFINNNYEKSDQKCFLEVDVQYLEKLHNYIMIYHFYQKEKKFEKVEKLVTNSHDKTEYVIHIKHLKQALKAHSKI